MLRSGDGQRLERLEAALSPQKAVALWLEERRPFATSAAYARWLAERPLGAAQFDRAPGQAAAGARRAMRIAPPGSMPQAERVAVRDVSFLMQLVTGLDQAVTMTTRIERLRSAHLYWQLRALTAEWRRGLELGSDDELGGLISLWKAWPEALDDHVVEIAAEAEARSRLEARYLEGRRVVFEGDLEPLDGLRRTAELMAAAWLDLPGPPIAGRNGTGVPMTSHEQRGDRDRRHEAIGSRAATMEADILRRARIDTLDALGDYRAALTEAGIGRLT